MLGTTLVRLRKNLGFKSGRVFYNEHLSKRPEVSFNYSYYMKIEGGRILPSPDAITSICSTLDSSSSDELILAYCRLLFPRHERLFKAPHANHAATPQPTQSTPTGQTLAKQRYLNDGQIACISRTREHYFVFLILTLARAPLDRNAINSSLTVSGLDHVLTQLVEAKLVRKMDDGRVVSICHEMRFPKADSNMLKRFYENIDRWNLEFPATLPFEKRFDKMMLRRISPRYLSIIESHCAVLCDLFRASDEVNQVHNDEVVMFNISVSRGRLPG